jgi:sulfite reductase alpha subunit-like flavoprotein
VNILPRNDPAVVAQVISKLNLVASDTLAVHDPLGATAIPSKVTIAGLFSQYLDLSGKVPPRLAAFAGVDAPVSKSIGRFLVDEFARPIDNFAKFLALLPPIEPRTYSIASERPDVAELVVADVFIDSDILGLCTGHLGRETTTEIAVQFIDGDFVYPEAPDTPLLLVALGSGIAPIFSAIEHRVGGGFGKCFVIYGLRFRDAALLAIERINEFKEQGAIDEFWLAVSRAEDHLHVADVIAAKAEQVWELWSDPKCELFYCGPPLGYDSVRDALVNITVNFGKKTRNSAISFTTKHKIMVESY